MRKALTGTALLLSLVGTTALAQSNGVPREFPPADFAGNQFVDSEGCAFIRAGISGNTNWVPRVDSSRRQLCNYQPTFAAIELEAQAAESIVADAQDTVVPNAPVETVAAAEEPAIEDLPLIIFPSAAEVAASNRAVTVPVPRRTPAAPSPRVIAAAPVPAPAPVVEPEVAPARITQAEVCDGKFGPQPGFISSSTGETIDCGPAPVVAAAPVSVAAPVTAPEPLRMTMAEICEAAAVGDRKFVDANTGQAIVCPSPVEIARVAAPVVEPEPAPAPQVATACPDIPAAPGHTVRCVPQSERPWTAAGSDGSTSRAKSPIGVFGRKTVPASNPAPGAAVAQPTVPSGFERTFNDGRHNPQRGLPATAATGAVQATQTAAIRVPAATPYRYVQVGSFGVHSNADNLLTRLAGMGLGTASGRSGGLKIVAVGPFTNAADMQRALGQVRALGFPDAFPRN